MTPFLKQVAVHYFRGPHDISSLCFIFPNRRALRFFEHYLGEEIAASGRGPVLSPVLFTMNDFFYRSVGARPSDRIFLLLELYNCYKALNPGAESLDEFIFWGDTLLGDFDDVDKYLVNPGHLFTNVEDFKEMQGDWSWLSEAQREAVERFTRHFLRPGAVKDNFLKIWRILLPLYNNFRQSLLDKGGSYEGMVYRSLAERLESESAADIMKARHPESSRFVFVGLNALNECEKTLLRKMHKAGLCEFCWDYRSELMRDSHNKSSFFLSSFTGEFPSAFETDPEGLPEPEINVLSVAGGMAQAKLLPRILSRCNPSPGIETAVVLPEEKMLIPVLNSIPEHIGKLNVTMGYPISGSQMWSLLSDLGQAQLHLRKQAGEWHVYQRSFWTVLSNSMVRTLLDDQVKEHLDVLRKKRLYYIPLSELEGHAMLELLFRPVATDNAADQEQARRICLWLQEVLTFMAPKLKGEKEMQLELDFAKVCHECLGGLLRHELPLLPQSLLRLLNQLLAPATVPFEGEPLEGMQIMGPLELRAMDFDNLVILNFNEGVFPRRSVSSSFIPPELRRGFGLPTYEYQDAVWAYYFYRMIQRASRVWLVYDSRTEGLKGGEPSRYLYQLQMHFGVKVNKYEALSPLGRGEDMEDIPKTEAHLEALRSARLSASSLKTWLDCPVKFFYSKVQGLKAEQEASESLDAGMIGNVLHATMQALYPKGTVIDRAFATGLLKSGDKIKKTVDFYIRKELNAFEVSGRNLVFSDVICGYARAVIRADLDQVRDGGFIRIVGVEQEENRTIGGFRFVGFIDRLDKDESGHLRVVDYKTGKVDDASLYFSDKDDEVPRIGLQLYLYKRLLEGRPGAASLSGAIYQPSSLGGGGPVMELPLDEEYCSRMESAVERILSGISELSEPWRRTGDVKKCEYCDYRAICGR